MPLPSSVPWQAIHVKLDNSTYSGEQMRSGDNARCVLRLRLLMLAKRDCSHAKCISLARVLVVVQRNENALPLIPPSPSPLSPASLLAGDAVRDLEKEGRGGVVGALMATMLATRQQRSQMSSILGGGLMNTAVSSHLLDSSAWPGEKIEETSPLSGTGYEACAKQPLSPALSPISGLLSTAIASAVNDIKEYIKSELEGLEQRVLQRQQVRVAFGAFETRQCQAFLSSKN